MTAIRQIMKKTMRKCEINTANDHKKSMQIVIGFAKKLDFIWIPFQNIEIHLNLISEYENWNGFQMDIEFNQKESGESKIKHFVKSEQKMRKLKRKQIWKNSRDLENVYESDKFLSDPIFPQIYLGFVVSFL